MQGQAPTVRALFDQALESASLAERRLFVEEACAERPELRSRVTALLDAHDAARDFLEAPAADFRLLLEELATPAADTALALDDDSILDSLEPPASPEHLGRLGHYDVLEVIGRGGMGMVLKAFDGTLGRHVAIKVMAPQLAASASARKRFTREARAMAAVRHDNVIDIHAVAEANGVPFLVMEYIAGGSLQERLRKGGALPAEEIVRIGVRIAAGLAAAHAAGLIHRDIKPANILLEGERVKITDFGLVRQEGDAGLSQSGVVAGTPQYMSPEQARSEPIDQRCDLFALGGVLYALCTGRPPFDARGAMAAMRSVCEDRPPEIGSLNPAVPAWLVAIVARLMEKEPGRRFQSAAEVGECLERGLSRPQHGADVAGRRRSRWLPRRIWLTAGGLAVVCWGILEATGITHVFSGMRPRGSDDNRVATASAPGTPAAADARSKDARSPSIAAAPSPSAEDVRLVQEIKYRERLAQKPDDPGVLYHLGVLLNTRQRWQEAEEVLRKAVTLNGTEISARNQLAIALRMQGKLSDAEIELRELVRLQPRQAGFHSNLGAILLLQGDFARAEEAFRESQRLLPNVTTMAQLIAALRSQGKHEEASQVQRARELLLKKSAEKKAAIDPPSSTP
jgi:serine/threonine protein kinase/cytochrome c-type biogenesis protein CcmH/NrfG